MHLRRQCGRQYIVSKYNSYARLLLNVYLMFDIAYQIQSGDSAGMAWYCPITHLTFTNIDQSWVCPGLGLFRTVCHYSVMESVQM